MNPPDPADAVQQPARGSYGIGEAARECGVSVRALRYYQEVGLLTPSSHTSGGNRRYADADLARVRRIRELQQLLGFNLDEIRDILGHEDRLAKARRFYQAASDDSDRARGLAAALDAYSELRAAIDQKIGRLESFRDDIDRRIEHATQLQEAIPDHVS